MKYRVTRGTEQVVLDVQETAEGWRVTSPSGVSHCLHIEQRLDGSLCVSAPWAKYETRYATRDGELWAAAAALRLRANVERVRASAVNSTDAGAAGQVQSPMAGKLLRLLVRVGDTVAAGQALAVVEAMKMENVLSAPISGSVQELPIAAPGAVDKGALVARIGPP